MEKVMALAVGGILLFMVYAIIEVLRLYL